MIISEHEVAAAIATGLVAAGLIAIVAGYAVHRRREGGGPDTRLSRLGPSPFLSRRVVEAFYWAMQGLGWVMLRLHIPADALSWAAVGISLASAPLAAVGRFRLAGLFVVAGAVLDALDGMVARKREETSKAGELLDSVLDRYADAAPLIGLAVFYRTSVLAMLVPLAAWLGATMLSYIRAKAEGLDLELPSGAMRRHERIVYLAVALVLGPWASLLTGTPWGIVHPVSLLIVAVVAIASSLAALRLFFRARTALRPARIQGAGEDQLGDLRLWRPWIRLRAWLVADDLDGHHRLGPRRNRHRGDLDGRNREQGQDREASGP
jgi:CDP-diacylglycerol---glycerol-3-phosphate 3-phosphatidyltransferase